MTTGARHLQNLLRQTGHGRSSIDNRGSNLRGRRSFVLLKIGCRYASYERSSE
jgi:hypothetical protein